MKTVAVIGGGASGMMAAITAASEGAHVILAEQNERVGKKILSTGNGRCNFTNIFQEPICYRSDNISFPWKLIQQFSARDAIAFFLELGVYSKNRNGYMYPNSDQASAVLDVLRSEMDRLGVDVRTGIKCTEILPGKRCFTVRTETENIRADSVILCAGSKAAPATGSDGSGYELAKRLGHRMIPVLPALVQLRCRGDFFKAVSGVRVNGRVSIWSDGECIADDKGEVQLTSYGISGIPVFQVSRYASKLLYEKREVTAVLDFMPEFSTEQAAAFLKKRMETRPEKTADFFLIGLFHKKLSDLWIKRAGIQRNMRVGDMTEKEIAGLLSQIKDFRVKVEGTNSFEQAQVCCGGIDTMEVDETTLESKYVPGLYFAGEILDVDGMCGGYNLQWAWASGFVAGKNSAH